MLKVNIVIIIILGIAKKIKEIYEEKHKNVMIFIAYNLINALLLPYLLLESVMEILNGVYFYIWISKNKLNDSFIIYELLFFTSIILTVLLIYIYIKFIRLVLIDVLKVNPILDTNEIGFIVKISTAITLFLTGLDGIFNNYSKFLPSLVTLSSFATFIFAIYEIIIIYYKKR